MRATEYGENLERKPRRTILTILLSALAIIAIVIAIVWFIGRVTNPAVQAGRVIDRTIDADNVIYNYEWFQQQQQDVVAMDTRLSAARTALTNFERSAGPRTSWRFDDRAEWNRLNSIVLGLQGQRAGMVSEYNARAQMANRRIFMSGDLPAQLQ